VKVYPAVDLREGACVQLVGGRYDAERVRLADPAAVAAHWAGFGFAALHVVDLDAATGRGGNATALRDVIARAGAPVQAGGGVRDDAAVAWLLAQGAWRVVAGTRAVEDPAWLARIAAAHPHRIVAALDARDGQVVTHGWARARALDPADAAARLDGAPLAGVLVTAVHREGRMAGPDLALIEAVRARTALPLIASGGIGTLAQLRELAARGADAAVVGMALYTGALDPAAVAGEFA
jgi:phosphoribosylformimino-5-aminoimidazole carboxamide ribotide isomerase